MDFLITLSDTEVLALTADLTRREKDGTVIPPNLSRDFPELIFHQIVRPIVARQKVYGLSTRIEKLQAAKPADLDAIDVILNKATASEVKVE